MFRGLTVEIGFRREILLQRFLQLRLQGENAFVGPRLLLHGDHHQHGELVAHAAHARFLDVATTIVDQLRDVRHCEIVAWEWAASEPTRDGSAAYEVVGADVQSHAPRPVRFVPKMLATKREGPAKLSVPAWQGGWAQPHKS